MFFEEAFAKLCAYFSFALAVVTLGKMTTKDEAETNTAMPNTAPDQPFIDLDNCGRTAITENDAGKRPLLKAKNSENLIISKNQ